MKQINKKKKLWREEAVSRVSTNNTLPKTSSFQ